MTDEDISGARREDYLRRIKDLVNAHKQSYTPPSLESLSNFLIQQTSYSLPHCQLQDFGNDRIQYLALIQAFNDHE